MSLLQQAKLLLSISRTNDIVRRYFVVNGFDGALTMLGLIIGFMISATDDLTVIINACIGACQHARNRFACTRPQAKPVAAEARRNMKAW